jgi:dTMP kinase
VFICFEGIDGAGKSTQARMLFQRLKVEGVPVEQVADPGTTKIGTAIRQILLQNDAPISKEAQMLLFSAARAELAAYIRQRLAEGVTVICDRWLLSTYVYQGEVNGIDRGFISRIFQETSNLVPDVCVLLDLPSTMSAERTGPGRDRYERVSEETRVKMRRAYLMLSDNRLVGRLLWTLDAQLPAETIHEKVYASFTELKERVAHTENGVSV